MYALSRLDVSLLSDSLRTSRSLGIVAKLEDLRTSWASTNSDHWPVMADGRMDLVGSSWIQLA